MLHRSAALALVLGLSALAGCKAEGADGPSQGEIRAAVQQVADDAKARVDARYATEQAAPAPEAPILTEETGAVVSLASFYHDDLDECADLVFEPVENGGAQETRAMAERFVAYYTASRADFVQVPKLCQEQFAGRPVLATCLVHRNEAGAKMTAGFRYYKSYTLEHHDGHMRDCLKLGGTWKVGADSKDGATASAR